MAKKREKGEIELSRGPGFRDADELFDRQLQLFRAPFFRWGVLDKTPRADMVDEGDTIKIRVDLPGASKDKIKVNVQRNSVSVRADAEKEEEHRGRNYYYRERSSSGYYRGFSLPAEVDAKNAKAKFSNGTLEITLKKTGQAEQKEVSIE